jgi:hypothetical protein
MKKILLLSAILAIVSIGTHLKAQCSGSNLNVTIKSITSTAGGCQVVMDMSFTGDFNNGNKFAFIHLWENAPVNNYPNISYTAAPTAAQLANAVATIVIADPGKPSAALYSQYPPNTSVPVQYTGVGFTKVGTTYSLTNVVINLSTCGQPVTIKGDVWASQADDGQVVHCFNTGTITLLLNNPVVAGFKQCGSRLLNLSFTNGHATLNESVVIEVFIDNNNSGIIDAGDIDITSLLSPSLPNPLLLAANSSQAFSGMSYAPYSSQPIYDTKPIIVRAVATAPAAASVTINKNNIGFLGSCSSLPVSFKSFTASRNHATVVLKWETATEQNSKAFAIERNVNGTWQQIASVPTLANGGNSQSVLSYSYSDLNAIKGLSQYRIRQSDLDAKYTYSEIRSVRGEGQLGKTIVYPNPSIDGKVSIVLEESAGVRDVSVADVSGRVIRQWRSTSSNTLQVENLVPGLYTLRIVMPATGEQVVSKFIISSH